MSWMVATIHSHENGEHQPKLGFGGQFSRIGDASMQGIIRVRLSVGVITSADACLQMYETFIDPVAREE
jgi:hypothetical protein